MQARALEAMISRFDPATPGFDAADNPVSPVYGGRMVDPARIHVWAWDARPWPAFPQEESVWSDGPLWRTGHWLNGRIDGADLDSVARELCARSLPQGAAQIAADTRAFVDGYTLDRPVSARDALEPLAAVFAFDGIVAGGAIRFDARAGKPVRALEEGDLVPGRSDELASFSRGQDSELPRTLSLSFYDGEREYRTASVRARRIEGASARESSREAALVATRAVAQQRCDVMLQDAWIARETARFNLRPGLLDLEIGDLVTLPGGEGRVFRVTRLNDGPVREAEARMVERAIYDHTPPLLAKPAGAASPTPGPLTAHVFSLGMLRDGFTALQYAAVHADPWPGAVGVWRRSGEGFVTAATITRRAIVGETLDVFGPGVPARFDCRNALTVRIAGGALSSPGDVRALSGAQAIAIGGPDGAWEVVVFAQADLVGEGVWRLSRLVRGLGGEEHLCARTLGPGAPVVVLDDAVTPLVTDAGLVGAEQVYRFADAASDYADELAVEVTANVRDVALRPYAPVRPRARRTAEGIEISFTRRARLDADGWGLAEIPLGEEREDYRIDILDGANVKRTLVAAAPLALYADEIADFGAPQSRLRLRIAQVSATTGPGFARIEDAPVG